MRSTHGRRCQWRTRRPTLRATVRLAVGTQGLRLAPSTPGSAAFGLGRRSPSRRFAGEARERRMRFEKWHTSDFRTKSALLSAHERQRLESRARSAIPGLESQVHRRNYHRVSMLTPDEITRLSPPERLALIGELWDSLGGAQLQLSEAQTSELARRLERFDQDRADGVGWAELKAELAARAL